MPVPPPPRKVSEAPSTAGARPAAVTISVAAPFGVLVLGLLLALGPAERANSTQNGAAAFVAGVLAAGAAFAALTLAEFATGWLSRRLGLSTGPVVVGGWGPAVRDAEPPHTWQQARRLGRFKPLVTFGAGLLLLVLAAIAAGAGWSPLGAALAGAALLTAALAILDLLPGPGRSGGLLVLARTWRRSDRTAAELAVARIGIRTGWSVMVLGLVSILAVGPLGLWIGLVGWLTLLSSRMEQGRATLHAATAAVPAWAAMTPGAPEVTGWRTVDVVLDEIGPTPYQVLPLRRFDGTLQAVLPADLYAVPPDDRDLRRAQDLARPAVLLRPDEPIERLLGTVTGTGLPLGLVVDDGQVLGVVGPAEIARAVSGPSGVGIGFPAPRPRRSVWNR